MRLMHYALLAFFIPSMVWANADAPVTYKRDSIVIVRSHPPQLPGLPWQSEPASENPNVKIDVEIRDGMILYRQEGWFNLASPSEKSGLLLKFYEPVKAPLMRINQYPPLDILLVDSQGIVIQILPEIVLAQLQQEIYPAAPVSAYLFLKGGTCKALAINPGDRLDDAFFNKPPTVLNSPTLLR